MNERICIREAVEVASGERLYVNGGFKYVPPKTIYRYTYSDGSLEVVFPKRKASLSGESE